MRFQFSENLWEQISSLGNKAKSGDAAEPDYADEEVKNLMKVWFLAKRALGGEEKREFKVRQAWRKVDARTRERGKRRFMSVFRYAAILVVLLGVALLGLHQVGKKASVPVMASADFIPSGSWKAELTLSNGEKIILDTNLYQKEIKVDGMNFLNDDKRGKLSYEGSSDEAEEDGLLDYHTLYVPKGGEYSLQLPDGSRVWLNSETTLRFPVRFSEKQREVFLCGEAYFSVAKDDTAPFRVKVTGGNVTVLGTCFNVSAYEDDGMWQTTLVEGSVSVEDGGEKVLLVPAHQYSVDWRTGERILRKVDPEVYTSWIDGKFYFSAYAFEEIVKKLERWYDFTMTYEDEEIRQMHFSGTINKHRPLNEVLRFLEKTTDIHFDISGKQIMVRKMKKG